MTAQAPAPDGMTTQASAGPPPGGPGRSRAKLAVAGLAVVAVVAVVAGLAFSGGGKGGPGTEAAFAVTTLAGAPHLGDGGPAGQAVLIDPSGVAEAPDGSVYVADDATHRIRKVAPDGTIKTVAGTGAPGFDGEGAPGLVARFNQPQQLAVDDAGNVFVADAGNHRVRRLSPDGIVTTVAGTGVSGAQGDGGPARSAQLTSPFAVAVGDGGVLFVADTGNRVVRRVRSDGTIDTVAGNGTASAGGDGGQAVDAGFLEPIGIAVAPDGALLVADRTAGTIRRIEISGRISTVAYHPAALAPGAAEPQGATVLSGRPFALAMTADGLLAVAVPSADRVELVDPDPAGRSGAAAPLLDEGVRAPRALAAGDGRLVVADTGNRRVVTSTGPRALEPLAGVGRWGPDQAGATARDVWLLRPSGVVEAPDGVVFVADSAGNVVWRLDADGSARVHAGTGLAGFSGDGGPATAARLSSPQGLAGDAGGALLIADSNNLRVRRVAPDGTITTVLGTGGIPTATPPAGTPAAETAAAPVELAVRDGLLAVTEPQLGRVLLVGPDGTVRTVLGRADDAIRAGVPSGVAFDPAGTLFVTDALGHRVLRVAPPAPGAPDGPARWAGQPAVTVFAGTGTAGYDGDRGIPATALFSAPQGIIALGADDVVVADTGNHRLRRVTPTGVVTVAGTGDAGASGDGEAARSGAIGGPGTLALRADGSALVAQPELGLVRSISEPGELSTLAGSGRLGRVGDRGAAVEASLASPSGVAVAADGTVYVADTNHHRVRAVTPDGRIRTVAGTGLAGSSGLGGAAVGAELAFPQGVAVTDDGRIVVADTANHRVVVVDPEGRLQALAGTGETGDDGDGGKATEARLSSPIGVAVGADGQVYVSDAATGKVLAVDTDGTLRVLASGLQRPNGLAVDAEGQVWVAVEAANQVVRVPAGGGDPEVVAGAGPAGFSGDGGPATTARLANPAGVALGADGSVYVTDALNARIRRIDAEGRITSVAGSGTVGRGPEASSSDRAAFVLPLALAVRTGDGALVVADTFNDRVRLLTPR